MVLNLYELCFFYEANRLQALFQQYKTELRSRLMHSIIVVFIQNHPNRI